MSTDFAEQITEIQQKLYCYIYSLIGSRSAAWDIVQETNIVLWKKREEGATRRSFQAWVFTVARFQVMAYLRDRKRDRESVMTPELMEAFGDEVEQETEQFDVRLDALTVCRKKLSSKYQKLLNYYYDMGLSLEKVGRRLGMSANATKQAMFRVRQSLAKCIKMNTSPLSQ